MKIFVGVNTLTSVDHDVYSNHCQFWYRLGRMHPDWEFVLNHPHRMSIDRMRNHSAQMAIETGCDYLVFIDDDVLVPVMNTLDELIGTKAPIAAGWTIIRGYPFRNMFFKNLPDGDLQLWENPVMSEDGLFDVDAVGFSCVCISVELLKKMKAPWFVTGPYNTEDVYFCVKARQEVDPNLRIVVHPGVKTFHGLGNDFIGPDEVQMWKKLYEERNPDLVKTVAEVKPERSIMEMDHPVEGQETIEDLLRDQLQLKGARD